MADRLAGLADMEAAYIQARASAFTDAEALRESGVARSTFYDWPKERRECLRNLALERKRDIARRALEVLEENAVAAAWVKVKGLKSRRENIQQAAASDILDRVLGKPTQRLKQEVRTDQVIELVRPDEYKPEGEAPSPA